MEDITTALEFIGYKNSRCIFNARMGERRTDMKPTETIFNGRYVVIPMADVQNIVKQENGILVITDKTKWNFEHDFWENPIHISDYDNQAEKFMKAWCNYRAEIDGMLDA